MIMLALFLFLAGKLGGSRQVPERSALEAGELSEEVAPFL